MDCADELTAAVDAQPGPSGDSESRPPDPLTAWIEAARAGCDDSFNQLFAACRPYLLLIANQELVPELQAKIGGSDIVQETLAHARQKFAQFRGTTQEELKAWVRDVLIKNMHDAKRRYLWTEMRQVSREVSLDRDLPATQQLIDSGAPSPGDQLANAEEAQKLAAALAQLPDDYREVIRLRHWEEKPFSEIGLCMARSPEAVRKLWARAIDRLREVLRQDNTSHGEVYDR